jgi:hypothetical protein
MKSLRTWIGRVFSLAAQKPPDRGSFFRRGQHFGVVIGPPDPVTPGGEAYWVDYETDWQVRFLAPPAGK